MAKSKPFTVNLPSKLWMLVFEDGECVNDQTTHGYRCLPTFESMEDALKEAEALMDAGLPTVVVQEFETSRGSVRYQGFPQEPVDDRVVSIQLSDRTHVL